MTTTDATPATVTRDMLLAANVQRTLYPLARVLGVSGYAGMQKPALVDAIMARDPADVAEALDAIGDTARPAPVTPTAGADALAEAIKAIAATVVPAAPAAPSVSPDMVRELVAKEVARVGETMARRVVLSRPELPDADVGVQHERFPLLLRACTARRIDGTRIAPWLYGPPGTGKTTAARAVARALSLEFGFTGALDGAYGLLGFVSAGGQLVRTAFRDRWEHGGVFLFDEIDASHPSAVVAFNAAIDADLCAFPDGMVERHPDCIVIAAANTTGHGATAGMTGRVRQDAASLDRFAMIRWDIDPALEAAMSVNPAWLRAVRAARDTAASRRADALISPRATAKGDALLAAGIEFDDVAEIVLRCGLSDDAWSPIRDAAHTAWGAA